MKMKKRDFLLILCFAALACVLLCVGLAQRGRLALPAVQTAEPASTAQPAEETQSLPDAQPAESGVPEAQPTAEATAEAEPAPDGVSEAVKSAVAAYFEEYPAESYLVLTTANGIYSPLPLNEENEFRIRQADGSENVIHIGHNSFYMASSNCENQNCVQQGEVTLENRDKRLLFNMVICLPHNLSLELVSREEAEELLTELYAQAEAEGAPFGANDDAQ